jgi:TetR/AcrR family transcriptional repressor of bet genes
VPRQVDQEERRRRIAAAVFVLISTRGFAAVTLRDVAREAGLSMGAVQHWFASKDEMLRFAMDHLHARVLARLQARLADLGPSPSRRAAIRAGALAQLPLDEPSRQETAVTIAFVGTAAVDPEYAEKLRLGYGRMLAVSRSLVRDAVAAGDTVPGLDADHEATVFYLLVQGMVGPLLVGALSPDEAVATLDAQLDRLFGRS